MWIVLELDLTIFDNLAGWKFAVRYHFDAETIEHIH